MSISRAKVPKAVQEDRRLAEKAFGAMNVDEKVNRAVVAADRAANAAWVAAVKVVQSRAHHHRHDSDYSNWSLSELFISTFLDFDLVNEELIGMLPVL